MDKTVTTPLDMGAGGPGQQRFVVAYTLKQGAEKQPDILSAQKGSTSSTLSLKDSLLCSPAAIRPDGLLLHNNSRNNYVSDRVGVEDNHCPHNNTTDKLIGLPLHSRTRHNQAGHSDRIWANHRHHRPP